MLSLQSIVVRRGGRTVIKESSASAGRGDAVALLGANGAGKTTLLHLIAGTLKGDSGEILYKGSRVDTASLDWRRKLSYVLDDGGTIPLLTVEEQLRLQSELVGVSHKESARRAGLVIDLLELSRYRGYRGEELSWGLRKRLGVGIGIVRGAEVFLFDEPYTSLDAEAVAVVARVLLTLKERGRTVIVASHSFPFSDNLYSRAWTLSGGLLVDHPSGTESREIVSGSSGPMRPGERLAVDIPWIGELP